MENVPSGPWDLRKLSESDDIPSITRLLHEAYAPLAAMGLRFTATWQDDEITRRRFSRGEPWVVEMKGSIVATVTLYPDNGPDPGCAWYGTPGVFSFGQFAVHPSCQRMGLGSRLIDHLEKESLALGARELALDTAEGAEHLIRWYQARGFRFIEHVNWGNTNYRSVILSKTVGMGGPG